MSLKTKNNILRSFSFRLTLWYAVFFVSSLVIIFFISDKILMADLLHVVDRGLLAQATKIDDEFGYFNLDQIKTGIRESIEQEGKNRIFYRLLTSDLKVVATSDPLKWPCLNFPQMSQWADQSLENKVVFHTLSPPDRNYKIRIISRAIGKDKFIIQIGKTMKDEEDLVGLYRRVFGQAVGVLMILGIVLAWLEAQKAMVRIDGLMRNLRDVTNNIAHDLRTPLTRIRGLAETAEGKQDPESLGMIVEECDRLSATIKTMLEIAEADAGLKDVPKVSVDVVALVKRGCELFEPLAQDKNISLKFNATQESLMIKAEPMRLQRVVANLLDNAIKFTSSGSIDVQTKKEGAHAVITVTDTGIGIESGQQERIFEKFYRIESSRSLPGNGLGLSYVQSMVASLGGSVSVQSTLGQGSTFTIKLPL